MRAVLQRVSSGRVAVDGDVVGEIGAGLVVLLGVADGDGGDEARWMAAKLRELRIFRDERGKMNLSVEDVGGEVLLVSQFTLMADCRRGRRPSFAHAAAPEEARGLYERVAALLRDEGVSVATGVFGARMAVTIENDGPVSMVLDTPGKGHDAGGGDAPLKCPLVTRLIDELPLVLGSSSPRRRRILEGLGLDFVVDTPRVDEDVLSGEEPREHVVRLAREKALEVAARHERGTVLAADTVVLIDGHILGKPDGPEDAVRMLTTIRGRWHEVFTGLAVVRASDGAVAVGHERTRVLVRDLTDADVAEYVEGGEPLDKAGSYAIQDCGAAVVERVDGCFYNVVGLPVVRLCEVLEDLRGSGRDDGASGGADGEE